MRRLVLLDLPWRTSDEDRPSLGHASLLASLRTEPRVAVIPISAPVNRIGFSVKGLVATVLDALQGVPSADTDVAMGVFVWNDSAVRGLIALLRETGFRGRIILGGPQITYAAPGVETDYPGADVFIRGQAEIALREVAAKGNRPRILGVHYAGSQDSGEQAPSPFANAPSPWLDGTLSLPPGARITWETRRGCPYRCTFCQHRQPGSRMPVAATQRKRIDAEIDLFCDHGVSRISVVDPVFNLDRDHAIDVLTRFAARGYAGELAIQCRAERITPEFLDAAQALDVCLEFGLQSIHPREFLAIGRPNKMDKVDAALRDVGRRGIRHEVSLIYGLPEQTPASFAESLRYCDKLGVPVVKAYPLLLLRGTALEMNRATWNLEVGPGDLPIVVRSNTFDEAGWQAMDQLAAAVNARSASGDSYPLRSSPIEIPNRDPLPHARSAALGKG